MLCYYRLQVNYMACLYKSTYKAISVYMTANFVSCNYAALFVVRTCVCLE